MLGEIDLSKKVDDAVCKEAFDGLERKLARLQREARTLQAPVMIVFEGWDAAGKGTLINDLLMPLDPRGFNAWFTKEPSEEEYFRPFLWRFWLKTPAKGRIALFDESWYRRVTQERADKAVSRDEWENAYEDIRSFERQLADDGVLIVKFFLHISKKEQKKRLEKLDENPSTSWRVTEKDWKNHKRYEDLVKIYEEMIERTDAEYAPWTVVEANDGKFAKLKIYSTVAERLEKRLAEVKNADAGQALPQAAAVRIEDPTASSVLKGIDLSKAMDREEYGKSLKKCQDRIREIEYEIYKKRIPVIIAYEGWDAAGKGGNIKRMVENLDPRGYGVVPVAAPNDLEKSHHYLWRFWQNLPKAGHMAIFDRTWYGRVLVERVEGFCSETEWRRAYREINEMERQIANSGAVLIKFWLQIDRAEQLKRFEERQNDPDKNFKITEEDWRNREKWDLYESAVDEMLFRTNTTYAPWTVVESNCKYFARIKALRTVIDAVEKSL